MEKFKILFLDHTPFTGGAQLALARHLNFLDYSKFEAVAVCSDPEIISSHLWPERKNQVRVLELTLGKLKIFPLFSLINFLTSSWRVVRITGREKPDLIVTNTERSFYLSVPAVLIFRLPLTVFVRDFEFSKLFLSLFYSLVSSFVCVSREVRDYYFDSSRTKAVVVYVGTDLPRFLARVTEADVSKLKKEFDIKESFLIGFVGRLVAWKGVMILPEIAEALAQIKGLPAWRIIVIGEGEDQEGSVETELRRKIRDLGVEGFFCLVGFSEKVAVWYKSLSVLLHTSEKPEPFATVIVEALSASLPIIATNLGGTKEAIINGQNGILVNFSSREFAQAILSLMRDSHLYQRLREGAVQSSLNYLEENITRQIEIVYLKSLPDHAHH